MSCRFPGVQPCVRRDGRNDDDDGDADDYDFGKAITKSGCWPFKSGPLVAPYEYVGTYYYFLTVTSDVTQPIRE